MVSACDAIVMLLVNTRGANAWDFVIVANVQAESGGVDVAVTPKEEETEDRLGEDIEDTVEHSLGVGSDDVATFTETPRDRVQEPQENGPATADQEGAGDIVTEGSRVLARHPGDLPGDEEEGNAAEDKVSPLV